MVTVPGASETSSVDTRPRTSSGRIDASDLAAAKSQFEQAHQRLFGFIEPNRTILIAAVEAEAASHNPAHPREGGDPSGASVAPRSFTNPAGVPAG